ncbi:hypothetical protein XELAEV_18011033mg [Xenopus laevis]|uniref:Uncharacterized protein n=1 Tax=Xenopus laevis TaxID=8355 RepID=A0A974DVM9_XENLA|nr:hypothetical protein XELAEV_18011033mg [Xenopus laevis]
MAVEKEMRRRQVIGRIPPLRSTLKFHNTNESLTQLMQAEENTERENTKQKVSYKYTKFPKEKQQKIKAVVDLSRRSLTETETVVLNKGLGFIPSNIENAFDLELDLFEFVRSLKRRAHFDKTEGSVGCRTIQHKNQVDFIKAKLGH